MECPADNEKIGDNFVGAGLRSRDLLVPFPSELMKIWPISTRVNKPQDDDSGILEPIEGDDDCKPLL